MTSTAAGNEHIIEYKQVQGLELLEQIKELFVEYARSLSIDLEFQDFTAELAELPGKYVSPEGLLLLVLVNGETAGMAALRKITEDTSEMKRLYVRDNYRGLGIGRRLVEMILEEARRIGYRSICLDTLPEQKPAQALYESFGFKDIEPYVFNPVPGTRYMCLEL